MMLEFKRHRESAGDGGSEAKNGRAVSQSKEHGTGAGIADTKGYLQQKIDQISTQNNGN